MFAGKADKPLQRPDSLNTPDFYDFLCPGTGVGANEEGFVDKVFRSALHGGYLPVGYVFGVGGELPRQGKAVNRYLLELLVKDTEQAAVPPYPDFPAKIFGRNGVICAAHLDVSVTVDGTFTLVIKREWLRWQRLQRGLFHFLEQFADLFPCGAVDASVGHLPFPVLQMFVFTAKAGKRPAFERVVLYILHPVLNFSLVAGHVWLGRQDYDAVMTRKFDYLGVQFRVVPVRLHYRRLEIVEDKRLRNAAP